jgi:ESS family glutamate:Na+ symporter
VDTSGLTTIQLTEMATLLIGIIAYFVGSWVRDTVPILGRLDMPKAVIGALIVALIILAIELLFDTRVEFGSRLRNALLLVFFTTIGLSAKLHALVSGGRPLIILCLVTVLVLVAQNTVGALFVSAWGAHPAYGVLAGSLSFVGGPGTALAWSQQLEAQGLPGASIVGVGASTLAVISGALIAGPVTGWIVARHKLRSSRPTGTIATFAPAEEVSEGRAAQAAPDEKASTVETLLASVFVIGGAVALGEWINMMGTRIGLLLPGFLSAMIAGVVLTNLADAFRIKLDFKPIETGGAVALQLFLVIALMATPLISVAAILTPLLINVALQVAVTVAVAYFFLFRLLGRDYDAAVTVGGFLGFGLSSMPVAMATMDEIGRRYGPSAKAFLLVSLAGSFFVDLANAMVAKAMLALPVFAIVPAAAGG